MEMRKRIKTNFYICLFQLRDLHNKLSARNFWVYTKEQGAFSVAGNSAKQRAEHCFKEEEKRIKLVWITLSQFILYNTKIEIKL